MIKSRTVRSAGCVALTEGKGEKRNVYKIFVGKPEVKKTTLKT
jgi:hypothetical protein